ncbi:MAG: FkbM family methyltransferase [Planctomycetota bacterium]
MGNTADWMGRIGNWFRREPWFKKEPFSEPALIQRFFHRTGIRCGIMLDVGAHFGESLIPYAEKGWSIFAFEPDPNSEKQAALARLGSESVRIFQVAICDQGGQTLDFYCSDVSTGISSLAAFHESHQKTASVQTETLANVISREAIADVDFLKIDAEGHDLFVLKGFDWRIRPRVVLAEFEDLKTVALGYSHQDLCNFLVERDYAVYLSEWYPIVQYGVTHRWRSIRRWPCELQEPDAWGNVIAVEQQRANDLEQLLPPHES